MASGTSGPPLASRGTMLCNLGDGQRFEFTVEEVNSCAFLADVEAGTTAAAGETEGAVQLPLTTTQMQAWRHGRLDMRSMALEALTDGLAVRYCAWDCPYSGEHSR